MRLDYTLDLSFAALGAHVLDVYTGAGCDASGHREGELPMASLPRNYADFGTEQAVEFLNPLPSGTVLAATLTDAAGNTSEFSNCAAVQPL